MVVNKIIKKESNIMSDNSFNVLDLVNGTDDKDDEIKALFRKHSVSGKVKEAEGDKDEQESAPPVPDQTSSEGKQKKKMWTPDNKLIKDMDEFNVGPVTYSKEELKEEDESLKNIADEMLKRDALKSMNEMDRQLFNIEECKKRRGYKILHIPDGFEKTKIMNAASDDDYERAQSGLDELFNEIEKNFPEWIWERTDNEDTSMTDELHKKTNPEKVDALITHDARNPDSNDMKNVESADTENQHNDEVNVVIDKTNLPEISWTKEEAEKIKKTRTVQLNIVEADPIEFSEIEDVPDNLVNNVLSSYTRKINDIVAPLPASKYRATFTGLSYPELLDFYNSQEMNTIDGEKKKWSIAFKHMKNQSIGPWETYRLYIDPETNIERRLEISDEIPENVDPEDIHTVSKFEDFLRKTSFLDLDFILWKILCATANKKEIISIDCHNIINEETGTQCDNTYDWIYSPNDLLITDDINPAVLEEMKITSEVSGKDNIIDNYNSSMLIKDNLATLKSSGFKIIFGHVSAYEYIEHIYPKIKAIENNQKIDPSDTSRALNYTMLSITKGFLIQKEDGKGMYRIKGVDNLLKIIESFDSVDWLTISKLVDIMITPYQFKFALRNIICPKCKHRSEIEIEDMSRLLFIVAQSLIAVQVELKSN
mgnify:CR=1 FL=1